VISLEPSLQDQIRTGLGERPRWLPAALLYDDVGSALFEAITYLPEYELTRTDFELLEKHSARHFAALTGPIEVVELGPGAGRKALVLIKALMATQAQARFVAVDVSAEALEGCRRALEGLPGLTVDVIQATYIEGLERAPRTAATRLVCFLGSNVSNFNRVDRRAFFRSVRERLRPGDGLLLAADLEKPAAQLLPAYDDALGVTAAFNRNVLVRLAREAESTLPLKSFKHQVRWNAEGRRVEMHLEALEPVSGHVLGVPVRLEQGETLWTESSHRFSVNELEALGTDAGFRVAHTEVSSPWAFAHVLYVA
jgi:dimethylhistidine N-methyltransferase